MTRTVAPLGLTLLTCDAARGVLARRRREAEALSRDRAASAAHAREALASRVREREALERHRARAVDAQRRRCERIEEAECDEAAMIAYEARRCATRTDAA
ncbi:MAG: hypothetical protein NVS4B5_06900 [Vulcanimicrobiaceae bacterium]